MRSLQKIPTQSRRSCTSGESVLLSEVTADAAEHLFDMEEALYRMVMENFRDFHAEDIASFVSLTGDANPIHSSTDAARARGMWHVSSPHTPFLNRKQSSSGAFRILCILERASAAQGCQV